MRRIKFVLWERYRAWWGAYQLHKENPVYARQIASRPILKPEAGKPVKKVNAEDVSELPKELQEVVEKTPEEMQQEAIARKEAEDLAKRLAEAEKQRRERQAAYEKHVEQRRAQRQQLLQSQFEKLEKKKADAKKKYQ